MNPDETPRVEPRLAGEPAYFDGAPNAGVDPATSPRADNRGAGAEPAPDDVVPAEDSRLTDVPRVDTRTLAFGAVAAVVVGAALIVGIGRLAGFTELTQTLEGAQWQWLAISAAGQVAVFAGYAGVFRSAVEYGGGPSVSTRHAIRVVIASFALTQLVAAGGAAGLAFTYWALRTLGLEPRDAGVRLIALNTAVYLVFATVAFVGAGVALAEPNVPLGASVPWLVAVPLLFLVAAWFTADANVDRWTAPGGRRWRQTLAIGVEAAAWVRRALGSEDGRGIFRWALLYWVGDLVSLWAALRAFGFTASPAELVVAYTIGYLAQMVPIPFVATGGVDAATTFTLTMVGVPVEIALLAVVAHRIFAFWLPIGPGLWSAVSLAREGRRNNRNRSGGAADAASGS